MFILELLEYFGNLISDILNYDKYRKIMSDPERTVKRKTFEYIMYRVHFIMIPSFLFYFIFWIIFPQYSWIALICALIPDLFVVIGAIRGHRNRWKKYTME